MATGYQFHHAGNMKSEGQHMMDHSSNAPLKQPLIKPSHRGLLHKELGVPQGQKIPASKLQAAKNSSNPKIRKQANFAINFGHK